MRYARRSPRVGIVLVLVAAVSTFAFNFNVLLPVLARETLDRGLEVFGILSACFGAGALAGALLAATIGRASIPLLLVGTAGFEWPSSCSRPRRPSSLLRPACSQQDCASRCGRRTPTPFQLRVPDAIRGRVLGLYFYAFRPAARGRAAVRLAGRRRRNGSCFAVRRGRDARGDGRRLREARSAAPLEARCSEAPLRNADRRLSSPTSFC